MLEYGTNIAAGVTPGKGGQKFQDVPIYETMKEAVTASKAKISIVFVPAKFFLEAAREALKLGSSFLLQSQSMFQFVIPCKLLKLLSKTMQL